jgi:hypothetical protein
VRVYWIDDGDDDYEDWGRMQNFNNLFSIRAFYNTKNFEIIFAIITKMNIIKQKASIMW